MAKINDGEEGGSASHGHSFEPKHGCSALLAADERDLRQEWRRENRAAAHKVVMLAVVLIALFILAFNFGRFTGISLDTVVKIMLSTFLPIDQTWGTSEETVVLWVRLPRILAAVLVGGALALAGACYQTVFKNPLVAPDVLGASAGASLGAAIAIFSGLKTPYVQVFAFVFAIVAVWLTCTISNHVKKDPTLALVLGGMFVASFASAIVSLIKFAADPNDKLPTLTYWLMGSLSNIQMSDIVGILVPLVLGAVPVLLMRWRLNVLSLGDDEAKTLGVETRRLRVLMIVCATVLTASAISIAGLVGWVGLVMPHLMRLLLGSNNRYLLPASALAGGAFLILVDGVARSLLSQEIPLGVLTALIGAPFFIALLMSRKNVV